MVSFIVLAQAVNTRVDLPLEISQTSRADNQHDGFVMVDYVYVIGERQATV